MIGIVTDSNAQLPPELATRYGVEVVPLPVTVDGRPYLEGVDLDADAFYAFFQSGTPAVSTAAPGPGLFVRAYEAVAARGATEILSVHIGSQVSATVNAARVAAGAASVPVRIVDTGTASFGIACCVWEAAEALAGGAGLEEAATVAEQVATTVTNVFVVGALDLARAGGRLAAGGSGPEEGVPVLTLAEGTMRTVGRAGDVEEAAEVMAAHLRASGTGLRVGLGVADAAAAPMWQALEGRLVGRPEVLEVVRYRVGPSVGAHTGPGTVGAFAYPAVSAGPGSSG